MARERAILCDLELEISHQLGDSIRDIEKAIQKTPAPISAQLFRDAACIYAKAAKQQRCPIEAGLKYLEKAIDAGSDP